MVFLSFRPVLYCHGGWKWVYLPRVISVVVKCVKYEFHFFHRTSPNGDRWKGKDLLLRLFVLSEYEKFMADLDSRSDRRQTDLVRRGLCPTVVELDGQNRILLPKILLEYAGLKDEVLYVQASGKTLELWNPERFNEKYGLQTNEAIDAFDAAFYGEGLTEGDNGR